MARALRRARDRQKCSARRLCRRRFGRSPKGREVLIAPTEPSAGVRVAFILDDGAPVELLEFYTVKAVRPKTRHAAEQRAAPDDGARAKGMRRRR